MSEYELPLKTDLKRERLWTRMTILGVALFLLLAYTLAFFATENWEQEAREKVQREIRMQRYFEYYMQEGATK